MKVIISSHNPVKIAACKKAFESAFTDKKEEISISPVNVPSGVSDQPMSRAETLLGAKNRAENAKNAEKDAAFWVGIESGLEEDPSHRGELLGFAWGYVLDAKGKPGRGMSSTLVLPKKVSQLILEEGKELGEADDIVFNRQNSKQAGGAVGLLTRNATSRTEVLSEAVLMALIPFLHPELY